MVRRWFFALSALALGVVGVLSLWWPGAVWSLLFIGPLVLLGLRDTLQRKHTLLRNFPVIGHGRYFMEMVRPEIQQYFIESNIDAFPIEREMRSVVYRRAKGDLDTTPFGTQRDVYRIGAASRWASSCAWAGAGIFSPSAGRYWKPVSPPTSSAWTVAKAAPARHRWNFPTRSACRHATPGFSFTARWSG